MHRWIVVLLAAVLAWEASPATAGPDAARWAARAAAVTITRDDWGIAHVRGKSDADAVFGAIYAQAEDDFNRIESNYLDTLGRRAEADGEAAVWSDLRVRLFIDPARLKARYAASPTWLRTLMVAWADGLNDYLATHPAVKPRVIRRFEPWMALSFSEGSIGPDFTRVGLAGLAAFYGEKGGPAPSDDDSVALSKDLGSNGIAIAPANTAAGHALLLINPHTSFFFRSELQMTSDAGLDAYGAATWGQFFIYQGFNAHAGWMHTSSGLDAVDEFAETIVRRGGGLYYRYGTALRPVGVSTITIAYRTASGGEASRTFTVYKTHHGPIVRALGGKWIAVAMMDRPVEALSQSFLRTKAGDYASWFKIAAFKANASNNTIFADDKGEIAFLHPQFIPRRDDRFDYTALVDGADPATDWKGLHGLAEAPHVVDPANGWVMNTNDAPWSAAAENSPRRGAFPRYMDTVGENPRGLHATQLLKGRKDFTLTSLERAAFDPYQPEFALLLPGLVAAYDALAAGDPLKAKLKEPVETLRTWDDRWGLDSVATSLAVYWGELMWSRSAPAARAARMQIYDFLASRPTAEEKLRALADAGDRLSRDFGTWRTPWGRINRFQRLTGDIVQPFDDAKPSLPVAFTSARWGSLASFKTASRAGTKLYGISGNSFVAVVEFGPRVRALAVSAGGESGDPASPHFDDQAQRYADGQLRVVYFYPDELRGHTERVYRPAAPAAGPTDSGAPR